ncbi:DNA polymerase theta-like [Physella acuta]|uniref:DNA polymerase theta-like n=1 Tax=Physella acuta TaxID=109671 RepID=UPI0027DB744A|nr:DNA polymerase theta-like [Physella acuta]
MQKLSSKLLKQQTVLCDHALSEKNDIKPLEGKRRLGRFPIVSTSVIVKKHNDSATFNKHLVSADSSTTGIENNTFSVSMDFALVQEVEKVEAALEVKENQLSICTGIETVELKNSLDIVSSQQEAHSVIQPYFPHIVKETNLSKRKHIKSCDRILSQKESKTTQQTSRKTSLLSENFSPSNSPVEKKPKTKFNPGHLLNCSSSSEKRKRFLFQTPEHQVLKHASTFNKKNVKKSFANKDVGLIDISYSPLCYTIKKNKEEEFSDTKSSQNVAMECFISTPKSHKVGCSSSKSFKKHQNNIHPKHTTSTSYVKKMKDHEPDAFSSIKNTAHGHPHVTSSPHQTKIVTKTNGAQINSVFHQRNESLNETDSPKLIVSFSHLNLSEEKRHLSSWGLPEPVLQAYKNQGVTTMFEWQTECLLTDNVLGGDNIIYSAPTSAGKTLVAELLVLKRVIETRKKALIVLPFISVAREKMYSLQRLYQDAGIQVGGFMGSYSSAGGFSSLDVAVCTIEKGNSIINKLMEDGQLGELGAIVVDELHMVGDSHRGYLLELMLTKLTYVAHKHSYTSNRVQIIGMSATLPNLSLLAKWLKASLYFTDFRPVPLTEYIKVDNKILDAELLIKREIPALLSFPDDLDHVIALSLETVLDGHAVLIFCPTKVWCENLCETIARRFYALIHENKHTKMKENVLNLITNGKLLNLDQDNLKETVEQLKRCPVGADPVLARCILNGVAYHHAGLTFDERDIIEGSFRQGNLKVLVATSTLSSGVNLPARRVIIRTPIFHGQVLDTLTYKQMAGRAGRKGVDTQGESILICKPQEKLKGKSLLRSDLPPVKSCLQFSLKGGLSNCLKRAVLEVVVSEVAKSSDDVVTYIGCTLFAVSLSNERKEDVKTTMVKSCIKFLQENELLSVQVISNNNGSDVEKFFPTQLGSAIFASSFSPDEGLLIFAELNKARKAFVLDSDLHIVYLVTPMYTTDTSTVIDWYQYLAIWEALTPADRRVAELVGVSEAFIARAINGRVNMKNTVQRKIMEVHQRFYTALVLNNLIQETPILDVAMKYNLNKGQLQSLQQTAATYAGMVTVFCGRLGWHNLELLLSHFQKRLSCGVQQELVDLVRISTLNASSARMLYNGGYHTVADVAKAEPIEVENLFKKASPFQSEKKQDGETDWELIERQRARCIWLTGRKGVTELGAAKAIIDEAKSIIEDDLGIKKISWQLKNTKADDETSTKIVTECEYNGDKSGVRLTNATKTIVDNEETDNCVKSIALDKEKKSYFGSLVMSGQEASNFNKSKEQSYFYQVAVSPPLGIRTDLNGNSGSSYLSPKNDNSTSSPASYMDNSKSLQACPRNQNIAFSTTGMNITEVNCDTSTENTASHTPKILSMINSTISFNESIILDTQTLHLLNKQNSEIHEVITNEYIAQSSDEYKATEQDNKTSQDKNKRITSHDSFLYSLPMTLISDLEPNKSMTKICEGTADINLSTHSCFERLPHFDENVRDDKKYISYKNVHQVSQESFCKSPLIEGRQIGTPHEYSPIEKSRFNKETELDDPLDEEALLAALNTSGDSFSYSPLITHLGSSNTNIPCFSTPRILNSPFSLENNKSKKNSSSYSQLKSIDLQTDVDSTSQIDINEKVTEDSFLDSFSVSLMDKVMTECDHQLKLNYGSKSTQVPHLGRKASMSTVSTSYNSSSKESFHCGDSDCVPPTPPREGSASFKLSSNTPSKEQNLNFSKRSVNHLLLAQSSEIDKPKEIFTSIKKFKNNLKCPTISADQIKTIELVKNQFPCDSTKEALFLPDLCTQQSFTIIDVCADKQLFHTFLDEWKLHPYYALSLACVKKIPDKKKSHSGIGGKFVKKSPIETKLAEACGVQIPECHSMIVGVAVSWEDRDAYYISLVADGYIVKNKPDDTLSEPPIDDTLPLDYRIESLYNILDCSKQTVAIYDTKQTYAYLASTFGITLLHCEDPRIADWLLDPTARLKNLHRMVANHCPSEMILLDAIGGANSYQSIGLDIKNQVDGRLRASTESILVMKLMSKYHTLLAEDGLMDAFVKVEMPSLITLARMELNGFGINNSELETQKLTMMKKLGVLEQQAYQHAGHVFSLTSSDDVARILYIELKLPLNGDPSLVPRLPSRSCNRRRTTLGSTSKEILEKLTKYHRLPAIILEWRRISSALTKSLFALQSSTRHCSKFAMSRVFGECQFFTATGRISMMEPNLQNIPKDFSFQFLDIQVNPENSSHLEKSRSNNQQHNIEPDPYLAAPISLRKLFIPFKGGVLLAADYCQLELRILAHLSGDIQLISILNDVGADVFKMIAAQMKGLELEDVSSEHRQHAKQVCYGMLYGIGTKALAEQLQVNEKDAGVFMDTFKSRYPGVRKYLRNAVDLCLKNGYVKTIFNRRRYLQAIKSTNPQARAQAERQAINTTIQGSAADLVKMAMVNIDNKLMQLFPLSDKRHYLNQPNSNISKGGFLVLQLHDELIYEISANHLFEISKLVKHQMETALKLDVCLPVKLKVGQNWADLQELILN